MPLLQDIETIHQLVLFQDSIICHLLRVFMIQQLPGGSLKWESPTQQVIEHVDEFFEIQIVLADKGSTLSPGSDL